MERLHLYKEWSDLLIAQGKAYRCYCTREELDERRAIFEKQKRPYKYEGTCRQLAAAPPGKTAVIRFKMPDQSGHVSFVDQVIGKITKEYSDLDDWIMLRADGIPLFNFGCVIDDHLMGITLVGRGQEHINSTFPQVMLYQALGWQPPDFAHFPLILGQDREKLSKRLHPEADVMLHAHNGVLPEALLNFIVRLGWSHGNDEIISVGQMKEWFGFDHVGTTSGVWNPDKLSWLNQSWLKSLDSALIAERLVPFLLEKKISAVPDDRLIRIVVALRERSKSLREMAEMAVYFYTDEVRVEEKAAAKHLTRESRPYLQQARQLMADLSGWNTESLDGVVKGVAEKNGIGMGKVAQPLRVAVTGGTISPGIGETLELIGQTKTLARLDAALKSMESA